MIRENAIGMQKCIGLLLNRILSRLERFIDFNRVYSNASITRPYIDYHDYEYSTRAFRNLKLEQERNCDCGRKKNKVGYGE